MLSGAFRKHVEEQAERRKMLGVFVFVFVFLYVCFVWLSGVVPHFLSHPPCVFV